MISILYLTDMERLWTFLFQETGGLGILEDLLLFVINMQMRLKRQLKGLMVNIHVDLHKVPTQHVEAKFLDLNPLEIDTHWKPWHHLKTCDNGTDCEECDFTCFMKKLIGGRNVDGRDIVVQFAKYGPNAEVIRKGRLTAEPTSSKRHRSRSPQRSSKRFNADYRSRDHRRRSRSRDRHDNDRYHEKEREYHCRSLSHSASPHSPSRSRSRDRNDRRTRTRRSRSHSVDSRSPVRHSRSHRSLTPQHHVPDKSSPSTARSPAPASLSPNARNKSPKPPSMSPSNSGA